MHACYECLAVLSECNSKSHPGKIRDTATAASPTLLCPEHNHMPSREFIKQGHDVRFLPLPCPRRCCNHSEGDERRAVSSVVLSASKCRRGFEAHLHQESQFRINEDGSMRRWLFAKNQKRKKVCLYNL